MNKGREELTFQMENSMKRPQNGNMICSKGPVCSGKEKLIFIDDHSITPGEAHNYLYILFSGARLLGLNPIIVTY